MLDIIRFTAQFRLLWLTIFFVMPAALSVVFSGNIITSHPYSDVQRDQAERHIELQYTSNERAQKHSHEHDNGTRNESISGHIHEHNATDHFHGSVLLAHFNQITSVKLPSSVPYKLRGYQPHPPNLLERPPRVVG